MLECGYGYRGVHFSSSFSTVTALWALVNKLILLETLLGNLSCIYIKLIFSDTDGFLVW